MKSISIVCPNCVVPLVPNQKVLGKYKNWYICPCCGYRERPYNDAIGQAITGHTVDRLRRRNNAQTKSRRD